MLTSLPVLALAFAHTGCNWGFLTLLVETPSYLKYALGIDIKSVCKFFFLNIFICPLFNN